jgi:hypothetical protein
MAARIRNGLDLWSGVPLDREAFAEIFSIRKPKGNQMLLPSAGLKLATGNVSQSIGTSLTKLTCFSGNGANASPSQWGGNVEGDQSITPDLANNRLLLWTPGVYRVDCDVSLTAAGSSDLLLSAFVNAVQQADLSAEGTAGLNAYALTAALSPAIVAANTQAEQTLAFAGTLTTDVPLSIIKPTAQAGLGITGVRIPSAGNVAINFANDTAGGITPTAAETYTLNVLRAGRINLNVSGIINATRAQATTGAPSAFQTALELFLKAGSGPINLTVEYAALLATRLE